MVEQGVLDGVKEGGICGAVAGFAVGSVRSYLYAQEYADAAAAEAAKNPRLPSSSLLSKASSLRPTVSLALNSDSTIRCLPWAFKRCYD